MRFRVRAHIGLEQRTYTYTIGRQKLLQRYVMRLKHADQVLKQKLNYIRNSECMCPTTTLGRLSLFLLAYLSAHHKYITLIICSPQ